MHTVYCLPPLTFETKFYLNNVRSLCFFLFFSLQLALHYDIPTYSVKIQLKQWSNGYISLLITSMSVVSPSELNEIISV